MSHDDERRWPLCIVPQSKPKDIAYERGGRRLGRQPIITTPQLSNKNPSP
jgi:hypothetical protein